MVKTAGKPFDTNIVALKSQLSKMQAKIAAVTRSVAAASEAVSEEFSAGVQEVVERLGQKEILPLDEELARFAKDRTAAITDGQEQVNEEFSSKEAAVRERWAVEEERVRQATANADGGLTDVPASLRPCTSSRLEFVVRRALPTEWVHYREHHYKDHRLQGAALCFVAELFGDPVAF